jgi:hypothetical protein
MPHTPPAARVSCRKAWRTPCRTGARAHARDHSIFDSRKKRSSGMTPETATPKEFADLLGFKRSYITQLRKDDRLVFTEDGTRILVHESKERIEATKDPARIGVVRRHAVSRDTPIVAAPRAPEQPEGESEPSSPGFQHWRERGEKAKALGLERDNAIADGKLLDAAEVHAAVGSAITLLRTRFEGLPDALAPELSIIDDEAKARAVLSSHIEHTLAELAREFSSLAKVAA